MSSSGKNVIIVLGVVTVVFAGYYFFSSEASSVLRSSSSDQQLQQMLQQTQQFVQHRQVLDGIAIDATFLSSPEFRSLRSFSPEPEQFQVGRSNPFLPSGTVRAVAPTESDLESVTEITP